MNEYKPTPVDTRDIILSEELIELTERIAKNTHDVWAMGRMLEGWKYGERRDDKLKTNPCLIPYDQLPDSEKEYDRNTSMETIKLIIKLGYQIIGPKVE